MTDPEEQPVGIGSPSEAHSSDLAGIVGRHAYGVRLLCQAARLANAGDVHEAIHLLIKGRVLVVSAMKELRSALRARALL